MRKGDVRFAMFDGGRVFFRARREIDREEFYFRTFQNLLDDLSIELVPEELVTVTERAAAGDEPV